MFMINEEAWHLAVATLKKYAGGKVTCKNSQREAFAALLELKRLGAPIGPWADTDDLKTIIKKECNANKNS